MLLPLCIYAVYAISFTMSKAILSYLPPLLYVGLRITTAGSLLLGYVMYHEGVMATIGYIRRHISSLARLMVVQTYIPYTLSFIALERVTSVEASLIYNISPCITALFSYALFNIRLHWLKICGLAVSMTALLPLFYNRMINVYTGASGNSEALLLLIVAVTSTTYGWLLFSSLYNSTAQNATLVSSFSLLVGGICMLCSSYCTESWHVELSNHWHKVVPLFTLLLLAIDIVFTNMYGYLLAYYSATFMALLGITLPLFTSLFSWLFLSEDIPNGFLIACLLMSVGLYIFYQGERKEKNMHA